MNDLDENSFIKLTFTLPKTTRLTEEIILQLDSLLDSTSPETYRNGLIELYHSYLINECDSLPSDFRNMAIHLAMLIHFLKIAGEEWKGE